MRKNPLMFLVPMMLLLMANSTGHHADAQSIRRIISEDKCRAFIERPELQQTCIECIERGNIFYKQAENQGFCQNLPWNRQPLSYYPVYQTNTKKRQPNITWSKPLPNERNNVQPPQYTSQQPTEQRSVYPRTMFRQSNIAKTQRRQSTQPSATHQVGTMPTLQP